MKRVVMALTVVAVAGSLVLGDTVSSADAQTADDKKRMQEQLNEQIMSRPFSVPAESEVKTYIEEQTKKGVVPQPYTGRYWRRGYTCLNLARYSRAEYLACRHYHAYYGRYYW